MDLAATNSAVEEIADDATTADPATQGGYKIVYSREAPLELRLQTNEEAPQEIGTLEAITAKVLVLGDPTHPTSVKVELSSESDLFFHYTHIADERTFKAMREEQRLMVEFPEYASVLATSFSNAIKGEAPTDVLLTQLDVLWFSHSTRPKTLRGRLNEDVERDHSRATCLWLGLPRTSRSRNNPWLRFPTRAEPNSFLAVFIMNQEGLGRLDFIQNVSFKFVELLSVPFNRSPDDLIRQQITFRYSTVKSKLAVMSARLQDVVNVVKVKNPSLLLQLTGAGKQGGASAAGGPAGGSSSSSSGAAVGGGGRSIMAPAGGPAGGR